MATATMPRSISSGTDIKLEYGRPEVFALRFVTGKNCEGRFGPRVLFTAVDERKLWLDAEDGSDLERGMRELGIQPSDFVKVTKIRHPRGGGHSIRVEYAELDEHRKDYSAELQRSIEMARARTASASSQSYLPAPADSQPRDVKEHSDRNNPSPATIQPFNGTSNSASVNPAMFAAYTEAIDTLVAAKAYAQSRGLAIEVRCEDVRCLAATIIISAQKGGR